MKIRGSGILLHITSLPSAYGIGDLGSMSFRFVDLLRKGDQKYWQILPLTPVDPERSDSPYKSTSVLAGNKLLISPELLLKDGYVDSIEPLPEFPEGKVLYSEVNDYKNMLLEKAYNDMRSRGPPDGYLTFCDKNQDWLEDYALFEALKTHVGREKPWNEWPEELRDRDPRALKDMTNTLYDLVDMERFSQYIFHNQWSKLKRYCNRNSIQIIGDMAIYVDMDSVDVWKNPEIFKLNSEKRPTYVSGVPPDYFSETGQLWGNPVYSWDILKKRGYDWWLKRIERNFELYDILRIDHFRGFSKYWEVEAGETTAINGKWREGPGSLFFESVLSRFPNVSLVAEDLGVITPDVRELMNAYDLPGLKVLMFGFDEEMPYNIHAPHNVPVNSIVYTGTHDNNTVKGWFENEVDRDSINRLSEYLDTHIDIENVSTQMVRCALRTSANTSIIPLQDLLGLDENSRMNDPSTPHGNWKWRMTGDDWKRLSGDIIERFRRWTWLYGRGYKTIRPVVSQ